MLIGACNLMVWPIIHGFMQVGAAFVYVSRITKDRGSAPSGFDNPMYVVSGPLRIPSYSHRAFKLSA